MYNSRILLRDEEYAMIKRQVDLYYIRHLNNRRLMCFPMVHFLALFYRRQVERFKKPLKCALNFGLAFKKWLKCRI